ncbi:MAG: LAGLIDADG family homing endonuclease [Candidatus Aenigmatarchaeota archaeon]|jgi:intein/homing endonuclease
MIKKLNLEKLSQKELGYLVGLFEGDGYAYNSYRHYNIEFYLNSLKDQDIVNQLLVILKKIDSNPHIIKDKRFNCLKVKVSSKLFYEMILRLSANNPTNTDFKLGFISGIIDSDGYVNQAKRYIQITNTNKKLMEKIQIYLRTFNIESKITKKSRGMKDKLQRYSLYVPIKFLKIKNNSRKIKRMDSGARNTIRLAFLPTLI